MDADELEAELRKARIDVEEIHSVTDPMRITYLTAYPGEEVHHLEVGGMLNNLIELAREDEWEPTRIEATVIRGEDDVLNTWYAEREWFEDLLAYRISETEFSTRVVETLPED
jgi:hypothetical protein